MKNIFTFALALLSLPVWTSAQITLTPPSSSSTVIQANPARMGLNSGIYTYYDNGNVLKNLYNINPSFEPMLLKDIYTEHTLLAIVNTANSGANTVLTATTTYSPIVFTGYTGQVYLSQSKYGQPLGSSTVVSVASATQMTITGNYGTLTSVYLYGGAGNTTSFYGTSLYPTFPANNFNQSTNPATFTVTESQSAENSLPSAKGCQGQITGNTVGNSGVSPALFTFTPINGTASQCSTPITDGDTISFTQNRSPTPAAEVSSTMFYNHLTLQGTATVTASANVCSTCGQQSAQFNVAGSGNSAYFQTYTDAAPNNFLYFPSSTVMSISYEYTCPSSSVPTMGISVQRGSTVWYSYTNQTLTCDSTWRQNTITFNGADTTTEAVANIQTYWYVSGGTLNLDNLSFTAASTNPSVYSDAYINGLKQYAGSATATPFTYRLWDSGQIGLSEQTAANWLLPTEIMQPANYSSGYNSAAKFVSLYDYLFACKQNGFSPYFVLPITMSTADAGMIGDFLSGTDTSTPGTGAYMRAQSGQTAPWTSVFPVIHVEIGNEDWNGVFDNSYQGLGSRSTAPSTATESNEYYDYSLTARDLIAAMRAANGYSSSIEDIVFNIQQGTASNAHDDVARANPDSVEENGYSGQSTSDNPATGTTCTTGGMGIQCAYLNQAYGYVQSSDTYGFYSAAHYWPSVSICGPNGNTACGVNVYEEALALYSNSGSVTQAELDGFTAGAVQAVGAAGYYMNQVAFGVKSINYFGAEGLSSPGSSGLSFKEWSNNIDFGGLASAKNGVPTLWRPQGLGGIVANAAVIGPMVACPMANQPTYNFPGDSGNNNAPALVNSPYLQAFCFRNGLNYSIHLINYSLTSAYTINFGSALPGTVTVAQVAAPSGNPNALNETATGSSTVAATATVAIANSTLTNPSSISIPILSATTLLYTQSSATAAAVVMSPKPGAYPTGPSVTLSTTTPSATIYYTTNGSVPTTASSVYSSPIPVSANMTIRAIAVATGYTASPMQQGVYSISGVACTIFAGPLGLKRFTVQCQQ